MSRELRSRLLTLLLLAAVAGSVYVWARRADLLGAPRARSGLLFPGLDVHSITYLYLGLSNGHDLELQREPGGPWRITKPTTEQAKQYLLDTVLDNLARAQVDPVEEGGPPLHADQVGLDPPQHVITFGTGDQRETLLLGAVDPLGRAVYAQRSGRPEIVLATRNLVTQLENELAEDFVDPSLLRGVSGPVTHIRVVAGDGATLAAQRTGDRWTLQAPAAVLADDARLSQLVRSLQFVQQKRVLGPQATSATLHAAGLPDKADVARGEQHGATLLEITAEGEAPVSAWIAAGWKTQAEEVAAVRSDLQKIISVPRASLGMLGNPPDFFREHHLLPPVRERAQSVRIERGQDVLLDIRSDAGGHWTFSAPARLSGEDVEAERVEGHSILSEFLGRIDGIEAVGFVEPPSGTPAARITLGWTRAGEQRLDRVDLFDPLGGGVPARTTERPDEGLLLPADVLALVDPLQADMLRRITPVHVDAARWSKLLITVPAVPAPLQIGRDAQGNWSGDDDFGRRYGLGKDMLRGFRGFNWQRARAGAEHPYGVSFRADDDSEICSVTFRLPAADEPQEAFGYAAAYATVSGHAGVELVVARDWIDRIDKLTRPPVREP